MTTSELARLQELMCGNSVVAQLARLQRDRSSWLGAISAARSFTEQYATLIDHESVAIRFAKQMQEAQKEQAQSIRKMLDPLNSIRTGFLADDSVRRTSNAFLKSFSATDHLKKLTEQTAQAGAFLHGFQTANIAAGEQAKKLLTETSVNSGLQQMMKSFEMVNKHWAVPPSLLEIMSPLKAMQDQIGRLNLPVIDLASAATLAKILGQEGIESQLAALGINPDGSRNGNFGVQEKGIGLSRKTMELMTLIGFILAVLVPIFQEYSSAQWQAETTQALKSNASALESQGEMIESLMKLLEKALVQEAKRQEERFVVRDRLTIVRTKPEHGAAVVGKLFPQEVVRPVSEDGKWIEFEYYHWLHQEYRTGWALKKYFHRVARPASAS